MESTILIDKSFSGRLRLCSIVDRAGSHLVHVVNDRNNNDQHLSLHKGVAIPS